MRCSDAVHKLSALDLQDNSRGIAFKELPADKFAKVEHLQRGLHKHLAGAPVFFPSEDFDEWFEG